MKEFYQIFLLVAASYGVHYPHEVEKKYSELSIWDNGVFCEPSKKGEKTVCSFENKVNMYFTSKFG